MWYINVLFLLNVGYQRESPIFPGLMRGPIRGMYDVE